MPEIKALLHGLLLGILRHVPEKLYIEPILESSSGWPEMLYQRLRVAARMLLHKDIVECPLEA